MGVLPGPQTSLFMASLTGFPSISTEQIFSIPLTYYLKDAKSTFDYRLAPLSLQLV
ncbi:MAG: hypothetical protein QXG17_07965 [Sulfolobales archaeon]